VNGETVTQLDINLATSQVSQRLQSIYGEEFSLEDLDEEVSIELIKNEVINQKILISQAKKMGLTTSEKKAKQEIINLEMFQGIQGFDQALFESSIRANGFTPEEYIELVQESMSLDQLVLAMGSAGFPLEKEVESLAVILETSRDINFIKANKAELADNQEASLSEAQVFYEMNPFLFLSQEKRDFTYIVLGLDVYKQQVNVPEGYIEQAYADYLDDLARQQQNRISHLMIEKSNYDNNAEANMTLQKILKEIQLGDILFEDAVIALSDDLASKDSMGDLGLSSGNAFPEEFEVAIRDMALNDLSEIIELEDSLHILKLTEVLKPEVKSLKDMSQSILEELIEAEAAALMQEDFLDLESLVLAGATFQDLADTANISIAVTGLQDRDSIVLENFNNYTAEDLFNAKVAPNKIEIFEGDENYAFVMLTQKIEPIVQVFAEVADTAMQEVRMQKTNELIAALSKDAEAILAGSKELPEISGVSIETFKNVKRFSSLLPSEVVTKIFESSLGLTVSSNAFNGDSYWAQSSNEVVPSAAELGESLDKYQAFYNEMQGQKFSGLIDQAFKKNQKVRLQNFAAN
jgi:peptidyl-prolyl cis-trans isomerase D